MKLFLLIVTGKPKLPFCSHLHQFNAIQFSRVEQRTELGPQCPTRKREVYNSPINMPFPILRHVNTVLTVTLGKKKELEENIFKFIFA